MNKLRRALRRFIHQPKTAVILASAGIGILLFWPATYISELLHGHYDPVDNTVSQLLIGPGSSIEQVAFMVVGLFIIAFTIGLNAFIKSPKKTTFYTGLALMIIIGLAVGFMAFTPPENQYHSGIKHVVLAATAECFFPIACLLLISQFRHEGWRSIAGFTFIAGALGTGLCIADVLTPDRWLGLVERLLIANGMLWFGITGLFMIYRVLKQGLKTA